MSDRRHDAMRQAVALALSGRYSNWWAVTARLRARRYREVDVAWSEGQRMWLDQLCNEARLVMHGQESGPPRPACAILALIDSRRRRSETLEGRSGPIRVLGGHLNHRSR
jgi:hypothetical protein